MRMYYNGGGAAWTRKEGQSPSGGLNQKGRDSYKGGTLKAPTKSKLKMVKDKLDQTFQGSDKALDKLKNTIKTLKGK